MGKVLQERIMLQIEALALGLAQFTGGIGVPPEIRCEYIPVSSSANVLLAKVSEAVTPTLPEAAYLPVQ